MRYCDDSGGKRAIAPPQCNPRATLASTLESIGTTHDATIDFPFTYNAATRRSRGLRTGTVPRTVGALTSHFGLPSPYTVRFALFVPSSGAA